MVLTGSNSYTGSTTVNSGSTLQLGGGSVLPDGSGAGIVSVNGTLDLDGYSPTLPGLSGSGTVTSSVAGAVALTLGNTNQSSTFSGVVQDGSGELALTKVGTGTMAVTGDNTFSGGTTISQGTAQLGNYPGGNTGTLGSGAVRDNAALTFELATGATIANAISGSGTLTQAGAMGSGTVIPRGG